MEWRPCCPEFGKLDETARAALIEAIRRDVDGVMRAHTEGDWLAFPVHAQIATAQTSAAPTGQPHSSI